MNITRTGYEPEEWNEAIHDTRPTFEDVTEALAVVRQSDDGNRWAAGDLAAAWLDNVVEGERMKEINRLAKASGYSYGGLRERVDCSVYWPKKNRRFDCAWSYYNRARRGVKLAEAVKRMKGLEDNPMSLDDFAKVCGVGTSNTPKPAPPPVTLREEILAVDSAIMDIRAKTGSDWLGLTVTRLLWEAQQDIKNALETIDKAAQPEAAATDAEAG